MRHVVEKNDDGAKESVLMLDGDSVAHSASFHRLSFSLREMIQKEENVQPISKRQADNICRVLLDDEVLTGAIACLFISILGCNVSEDWHTSASLFDYSQMPAHCQRLGRRLVLAQVAHKLARSIGNRISVRVDLPTIEAFVVCAIRETEHRLSSHRIYSMFALVSLLLAYIDFASLLYVGCTVVQSYNHEAYCTAPAILILSSYFGALVV